MKKVLKLTIVAASVLAMTAVAEKSFAQTTTANLSVALAEVRSVKVNSGQQSPSISFSAAPDYVNGQTTGVLSDHLEVTSTTGFKVTAKAGGDLTNGGHTIPISTIEIDVTNGSTGAVGTLSNITTLSTSDQTLITTGTGSTTGTAQGFYNIEYKASGGANYIGKPTGTYTATITYTIDAP